MPFARARAERAGDHVSAQVADGATCARTNPVQPIPPPRRTNWVPERPLAMRYVAREGSAPRAMPLVGDATCAGVAGVVAGVGGVVGRPTALMRRGARPAQSRETGTRFPSLALICYVFC